MRKIIENSTYGQKNHCHINLPDLWQSLQEHGLKQKNMKISDNAFKSNYLIRICDFSYLKPRAAMSVIKKKFVIWQ